MNTAGFPYVTRLNAQFAALEIVEAGALAHSVVRLGVVEGEYHCR
jgi:hypothetical protein